MHLRVLGGMAGTGIGRWTCTKRWGHRNTGKDGWKNTQAEEKGDYTQLQRRDYKQPYSAQEAAPAPWQPGQGEGCVAGALSPRSFRARRLAQAALRGAAPSGGPGRRPGPSAPPRPAGPRRARRPPPAGAPAPLPSDDAARLPHSTSISSTGPAAAAAATAASSSGSKPGLSRLQACREQAESGGDGGQEPGRAAWPSRSSSSCSRPRRQPPPPAIGPAAPSPPPGGKPGVRREL